VIPLSLQEGDSKPSKSSTVSSLLTRNRFTPSSQRRFGTQSTNNPVASSSLKYTSIQRNRPSTTSTTNSPVDEEDVEDEESVPVPQKKKSFASSLSRKYVTLSRNSKQTDSLESTTKLPSSTETSIVVRFSGDDKLLDETETKKGGRGDVDDNDELTSDDRYVTISRPYSKISGTSVQILSTSTQATAKKEERQKPSSSSSNTLRYVQLSRTKGTTSVTEPKSEKVAVTEIPDNEAHDEEQSEEEYDSEEDHEESTVEHTPSTTTTTTSTTTTTKAPTTTQTQSAKSRLRIPTRKTNGFSSRTRGTTTSTTTTKPETSATVASTSTSSTGGDDSATSRKARNFAVGNRRNLFQSRTKATTTTVPDAASSQTANDER